MIRKGDVIENPVTGERLRLPGDVERDERRGRRRRVHGAGQRLRGRRARPPEARTERFEMLSREVVTFKLDGEEIVARAGDAVIVPAGVSHKFWNAGDDRGDFVCEIKPALQFEQPARDDVRARGRRQDEPEGDAEPAPPRRDRERTTSRTCGCRSRPPGCRRSASRWARRSAACSATSPSTRLSRRRRGRGRARALTAAERTCPRVCPWDTSVWTCRSEPRPGPGPGRGQSA